MGHSRDQDGALPLSSNNGRKLQPRQPHSDFHSDMGACQRHLGSGPKATRNAAIFMDPPSQGRRGREEDDKDAIREGRAGHGQEDAPARLAALARSRRPQDKDQEDVEDAR
mmetsp:Transcript_15787/g.23109  ORF Transcript_15787/g.23109 Transcript_15787/m.23109 type:complete len:111 (+) Transcript_15787:563-895(+)